MNTIDYRKIHDKATVSEDGLILDVSKASTVIIEVSGTATNFSIDFMVSIDKNEIFGKRLGDSSDETTSVSTVTSNGIWEVDVEGYIWFKVPLTINSGNTGYVTTVIHSIN